ncbi:MAG: TolB family protein, partial [Bryobacteraceae bacterium]
MTRSLPAIACLIALAAPAQQKQGQQKKAAKQAPAPRVLPRLGGEIDGQALSDPGRQSDWPAAAYAGDGSLYVAYVEWNDKDADRVLVRRRDPAGRWAEPVAVSAGTGDHYGPAVAGLPGGALVVWPAQTGGNFELYAAEVSAGGAGRAERLTRAPHGDFNVRAAADVRGNVTVVWQSFRNGNADIYARRRNARVWGPEVRVSASDASDWEPALALEGDGKAWIAWDSYHHGNYDVFLRSFDGTRLSDLVTVTTEPTAQFHASVAVDPQGRVWIAWDDSGPNWGKDFSASSGVPGFRGLHAFRTLDLRVWANGRLETPVTNLRDILSGEMAQYAELPHLGFDASGALWMVFRHWTEKLPHEIFHFYAARLTGERWSLPYRLTRSAGPNSHRATLALNPRGGITVTNSSDGRSASNLPKDQTHALHYAAYVSELERGNAPATTATRAIALPAAGQPSPRRPRHTMAAGGKTYTLMLGDCHRHTDVRGHSGVDASLLDTYRYAIDAAQLDYLGVSDHNEVVGGAWPDGLRDYQWW